MLSICNVLITDRGYKIRKIGEQTMHDDLKIQAKEIQIIGSDNSAFHVAIVVRSGVKNN
jgi:hypothetical protein